MIEHNVNKHQDKYNDGILKNLRKIDKKVRLNLSIKGMREMIGA